MTNPCTIDGCDKPSRNSARGSQRRAKALRDSGWWSNNDTIAGLRQGRRKLIDPR